MRKRITATLLSLVMIMALTACADSKPAQAEPEDSDVKTEVTEAKKEQRSNVKETDPETGEEYWLLADFEDYFECTQVKYQGSFGTVTQVKKSENPEMVTYGNQSAKLEILGTEQTLTTRNPILRIATNSGFFNATTDFSDLSRLTFDLYNDMDYEVVIRFYVADKISPDFTNEDTLLTSEHYEFCITQRITLQPKQWNHVEISADTMAAIEYPRSGPVNVYGAEALDIVGAFCIMFDRGELHEQQQVYYIDNVRAYLKGSE